VTTTLEQTRRQFLRTAAASAGGVALNACGGGGPADDSVTALTPVAPAPVPAPAPGPAPAPAPAPVVPPFTWQIAPDQVLLLPAGSTTTIATGAVGLIAQVSPDLPPGRTLSLAANGDLAIVAAPNAPPVDLAQPWVIEVMDSPIATVFNRTLGRTYQRQWNRCMEDARHGDLIEVSPGAIHGDRSEMSNYFNGLDSCMLAVSKGVTIRNIPGRGRWGLLPGDEELLTGGRSGIVIFSPQEMGGRFDVVLEGFEFDNWGQRGDSIGIRVRESYSIDVGSWNRYHRSLTLRNFKIGKRPYYRSASGVAGTTETMTIENGHVYDTGGGINAGDGQDHNFYISARNLYIRGVRAQRSRGHNADGTDDMDGHIMKLSAVNAWIEGCVLDADPQWGDNTHHIQAKAGGNFVIRGNLFIDSVRNQSQGRGPVNMCKELSMAGLPNYSWWASSEGNSLLVEKNVFINHYGRPMVYFFPAGHSYGIPAAQMRFVTIRDNIGMAPATPTVLAHFDDSKWIANDPLGGPAWSVNNSVMPYGADEPGFSGKPVKVYTRTDGPIPASAGEVATRRFQYPHGHVTRVDAHRGLG
jgi:hypothetical protein